MATITIKSIPDELYERLKQSAAAHRRSINSEVIVCLEGTFASKRIDAVTRLSRVDALRERVALPPLTEDTLKTAKNSGRP
ncbi:MAG: Arc family DNA-binding protein [Thermoleophilia bacterium]|nr:Arc family DNA-binding protein [Thermoleophilia bacterium]